MRALAIALLSACGIFCARPALASGGPLAPRVGVTLLVDRGPGTEECIGASALEQAVEARLQRAAFLHHQATPLRIRLRLARIGKRQWSAELRLEAANGGSLGERKLTTAAAHCSALDDSLALVVALLVDAPLGERERELEGKGEQAAPSQPAAPTERTTPSPLPAPKATLIDLPPNTLAPRQPWRWEASLAASLALGLLPRAGWGLELGVSAKPATGPELRLFLQGYAPRDAYGGPEHAGAHFDALFVGLEVCPLAAELGTWRLAACAGQNLGRLHASAFGYDQNSSANDLLYTLLARAVLLAPVLGRLSARLSARAEIPLSRPAFYYGARENNEATVFELSPALAVFEAGLSIAL